MDMAQSEKRLSRRVKAQGKVHVQVLDGRVRDDEARLRDVSMSGVFLYLHNEVTEGASLEMVLPLPQEIVPGKEHWIRCKCRIVRVEKNGNAQFGVAAMIEDFEPLDTAKLPEA